MRGAATTRRSEAVRSKVRQMDHTLRKAHGRIESRNKPPAQARAERAANARRALAGMLRYLAENYPSLNDDQLRRQRRTIVQAAQATGDAALVTAVEERITALAEST